MANYYHPGIKRMADYVGRRVKLVRRIETVGGSVFDPGTPMYITGHHRGKLTMTSGSRTISQVLRSDIELESPPPET